MILAYYIYILSKCSQLFSVDFFLCNPSISFRGKVSMSKMAEAALLNARSVSGNSDGPVNVFRSY